MGGGAESARYTSRLCFSTLSHECFLSVQLATWKCGRRPASPGVARCNSRATDPYSIFAPSGFTFNDVHTWGGIPPFGQHAAHYKQNIPFRGVLTCLRREGGEG